MATLILTHAHLLEASPATRALATLPATRPSLVAVEAVAGAAEARARLLAHRPETVIVTGHPPDGDVCTAVARTAATETPTRVVYLAACETASGGAVPPRPPGICAILTRENDFEDLLATLLLVLHGGLFPSPPPPVAAVQGERLGLSRRELEVLQGIAAGQTTKHMARALGLSPKTVETYRNRLMQKLGLGCAADLIRFAVRNGLAP
ncbi:helix-turn-helix transcriptional regulator [Pseudothauera rhizosphaerae]|uniref:Helix-turn-helix transcriptional regulator n=1 Tax=Pseudothauera rhizosphaerae TaxID=2565932 RepID=A0A4S4AC16_9RHOO|nr:LuxR family transcriptional regulator [Pseudothauera rhizosphaerae]THF56502.1 helix-turn-helix transcriptional regulator [Pseudothauera rhizosphaerae]